MSINDDSFQYKHHAHNCKNPCTSSSIFYSISHKCMISHEHNKCIPDWLHWSKPSLHFLWEIAIATNLQEFIPLVVLHTHCLGALITIYHWTTLPTKIFLCFTLITSSPIHAITSCWTSCSSQGGMVGLQKRTRPTINQLIMLASWWARTEMKFTHSVLWTVCPCFTTQANPSRPVRIIASYIRTVRQHTLLVVFYFIDGNVNVNSKY